jgi:hypothetical protein
LWRVREKQRFKDVAAQVFCGHPICVWWLKKEHAITVPAKGEVHRRLRSNRDVYFWRVRAKGENNICSLPPARSNRNDNSVSVFGLPIGAHWTVWTISAEMLARNLDFRPYFVPGVWCIAAQ